MERPTATGKDSELRAAARAAALCGARLRCPDEPADKRAVDFLGERVDIESFTVKKCERVLNAVDAGRLHVDSVEAGLCRLRHGLVIAESAAHPPPPPLQVHSDL